jgi:hypothetical protein
VASKKLHHLATLPGCLLVPLGLISATTAGISRAGKHANSLAVLCTSRSPSPGSNS